jgi:peptide/nickel transport system permease protein
MRIQAQPYMEAADVIGSTLGSKLRYYLVPNMAPIVIPAIAQELAAALLIVAELGFLGIYLGISRPISLADLLGGQQPQLTIPEWGGMLAGTRLEIFRWYWLTIMPAAAFMVTILSFNLLADGLRRHLERP